MVTDHNHMHHPDMPWYWIYYDIQLIVGLSNTQK